jgi:hypothetical protein
MNITRTQKVVEHQSINHQYSIISKNDPHAIDLSIGLFDDPTRMHIKHIITSQNPPAAVMIISDK